MSDYIKRNVALDAMRDVMKQAKHLRPPLYDAIDNVKNLPSADVVEVVRCKDCRHNGSFDTDCPFGWRDERFNLPDDMDFCSYGER